MEVLNYYVTTIGNSFKNLAPYIAFIFGGYFIFVKLPFLFFRKSLNEQKLKAAKEEKKIEVKPAVEQRQNPKNEEKKKEAKKEEKKVHIEKPREESFQGFRAQDKVSKEALKKRYFELIKENHPDRVAMMGKEFRTLAEKNTKEINETYDRLKKKAA